MPCRAGSTPIRGRCQCGTDGTASRILPSWCINASSRARAPSQNASITAVSPARSLRSGVRTTASGGSQMALASTGPAVTSTTPKKEAVPRPGRHERRHQALPPYRPSDGLVVQLHRAECTTQERPTSTASEAGGRSAEGTRGASRVRRRPGVSVCAPLPDAGSRGPWRPSGRAPRGYIQRYREDNKPLARLMCDRASILGAFQQLAGEVPPDAIQRRLPILSQSPLLESVLVQTTPVPWSGNGTSLAAIFCRPRRHLIVSP